VFGALSCAPSTHFSAAADLAGDLATTTNPTGGASSWKLSKTSGSVSGLSCPSAKLCFAVSGGNLMFSRNPGRASSWRTVPVDRGANLDAISCPTAHFCAATASTDITAELLASANPTGGPRAWHRTYFPYDQTNFAFSDVSCPSARLCIASDAWGNVFTTTHPKRRGWRWTHLPRFDARYLSCPSTRLCVSANVAGIASSTRPAGGARTWTVNRWPTELNGEATVGCASSMCVVGDSADNVLTSTRPSAGVSTWARFNLGQGYNTLTSISCPNAGLCVAGDDIGNVVGSTNPTGGAAVWSVHGLPADPTGNPSRATSLSCPSESLCAAVWSNSILTSTDPTGGAAAWTVTALQYPGLTSISCPSSNLCVAGAGDGSVWTSTDPTGGSATWHSAQLGQPAVCGKYGCDDDSIAAVSCASEQLCAATDGPNLWVSTDPATPGATWTKSKTPGGGHVLTCPAENLCVTANLEEIDATPNPSSPSPTWTITHLPPVTGPSGFGMTSSGSVSSVSCPSTQQCVAVDVVAGYAFMGNPTNPSSWTATKIDSPIPGLSLGPVGLTGVSCPPSGPCIAVDAGGNAIVGQLTG
jgi:hypothetical protein